MEQAEAAAASSSSAQPAAALRDVGCFVAFVAFLCSFSMATSVTTSSSRHSFFPFFPFPFTQIFTPCLTPRGAKMMRYLAWPCLSSYSPRGHLISTYRAVVRTRAWESIRCYSGELPEMPTYAALMYLTLARMY